MTIFMLNQKTVIMSQPFSFEVEIQKACGIDMHKDKIKSCYLGIGNQAIIQDFGTTTEQIRTLCEDIRGHGISNVIIESTGIYWIPLYDMLTSRHINVLIANQLRV